MWVQGFLSWTVSNNRFKVLKIAFDNFKPDNQFKAFCKENDFWLNDFAIYMALKEKHNGKSWDEWEKDFVIKSKSSMDKVKIEMKSKIDFYKTYLANC